MICRRVVDQVLARGQEGGPSLLPDVPRYRDSGGDEIGCPLPLGRGESVGIRVDEGVSYA